MKLGREFYTRDDVVGVARDLLGKVLVTRSGNITTSGIITEAEAYAGIADRASHAYGGRRTARTAVMYSRGGVAYVYLCYGVHSLFNVVTNRQGIPDAVLVRSILPLSGEDHMIKRMGYGDGKKLTGIGPGVVSRAMGIHFSQSGTDLLGDTIWIEDHGIRVPSRLIMAGPRVGVEYAAADALLPYRFRVDHNSFRDGSGFSRQ